MKNLDMTKGNALPKILQFAIPLMLGDLFQQLYIAIDSAMIGRYASGVALAAVGSSTFLIRLVIGFFLGISAGAGVVVAQRVGAREEEEAARMVTTIIGMALVGGVLLTVLGVSVTVPLLHAVFTPEEVMGEATNYLRIYFAGSLFSLFYNVGSGILCAYGDSKRPFCYLACSSVVNILLDYQFIKILHLGAFGAALATMIAQAVSAVFVLLYFTSKQCEFRIAIRKIRIEKEFVPEILRMGLPAGLQNAVVALSNVIIQANINSAGTAAMAGFGVFNKVDGIIMLPLSSIALALTTYTAQNYGAGKKERIREGIKAMLLLEIISWIVGSLICIFFGKRIFSLFTTEPEVVDYAMMVMRYLVPGYWGLGIGYALTCMIRGMGRSHMASFVFIFNMCVVRQLWILILKGQGFGLQGVLSSYPVSWIMTIVGSVLCIVYLQRKVEFLEVKGTE